jgi:hypothetical protein
MKYVESGYLDMPLPVASPAVNQCDYLAIRSELAVEVMYPDGLTVDYGVLSRRIVTTAFVSGLVSLLSGSGFPGVNTFVYHQIGTGSNPEDASQTALVAPVGPPVSGTRSATYPNQYVTQATQTVNTSGVIFEHGVFNSLNMLLDRSKFSTGVPVTSGVTVTTTYTLTIVGQ